MARLRPTLSCGLKADTVQAMHALIEATVKDGGKLTPQTMKKLQNAGRAAKSQGLDLKIEKALLESDFDADMPQAPAANPNNL